MAVPKFKFASRGNFVDGEFVEPTKKQGEWTHKSPADLSDVLGTFSYSYSDVDWAVDAAKSAFVHWRKIDLKQRCEYLKSYQSALKRHEEELVEAIARETGKPLWESKTEFTTMVNKVDVTIQEGLKIVSDYDIPSIMEGTLGSCHFRAHGVMAVIGPFNFPGHLPNGHIVPALLSGNTIVFKPSEKTPLTAQLMAQCFSEAELPRGVFNVVQGEKEVGRRLCVHEGVSGVLFTGSYEVGMRIKQDTLQQHWKILALEMGGKNPAIVWEDAHFEAALREVLIGAYLSCGQRCSATSRVIVHSSLVDRFTHELHEKAKNFKIGSPFDAPFMGPLIDQSSVDRYTKFLGIAAREGGEIVMRGKVLELSKKGNYVSPSICTIKDNSVESAKKSVYQQSELFAPNVAILSTSDLTHAIELANATQYGLVASIFTQSRIVFEQAFDHLEFGLINWNKSTVGASSRLPFGGVKKSGNHMPTAVSASLYCAYPVSSLEVAEPKSGGPGFPGLTW
jgi:succinylglutamic semialdehyde dehydrogenase